MAANLTDVRRSFAAAIETDCKLRTKVLVEAIATIPREQFLQSGPMVDSR